MAVAKYNFKAKIGQTIAWNFTLSTAQTGFIGYTLKKDKALSDSASPLPAGVVTGQAALSAETTKTITWEETVTDDLNGIYFYDFWLQVTSTGNRYPLFEGEVEFEDRVTTRTFA